jgi:hypothetical protein
MRPSLPPREGSSVQLANNNPGGRTHAKESVLPPVSGVQSNVPRGIGNHMLTVLVGSHHYSYNVGS